MKLYLSFLTPVFIFANLLNAAESKNIVLDEIGVKNLRIQKAQVEKSDFESTFFALGITEAMPEKRSQLSSRIPGRVVETHLKVGAYVTKGEKMLLVESRQPGDPPPSVWLTAPASGTIVSTGTVLGAPVEPSDTLAHIADLQTIFGIATLPQNIAGKIKQGTQARVHFPTRPDLEYTATLWNFAACACPDPACALGQDVSISSSNKDSLNHGSAAVVFTIENPDNRLRPGMNAEFQIILNQRTNVLSIPRSALQGEPSDRHVFIVDSSLPNAFVKTPVQIGEINDRLVEIIAGVSLGDEVVTQGAYSLGFVGSGNVSLKEALDAAHGHEHAADGSELSDDESNQDDDHDHEAEHDHDHEAEHDHDHEAEHDHDHEAGHDHGEQSSDGLWKIISAVLFFLLIISVFIRLTFKSTKEAR